MSGPKLDPSWVPWSVIASLWTPPYVPDAPSIDLPEAWREMMP